MAVGDIIVGIQAAGAFTNYQPSSSVELIVTSLTGQNQYMYFGQYDGTNFNGTRGEGNQYLIGAGSAYGQMSNMKLGITNTYYFRFYSDSGRAYFSAIQTK